MSCLKVFSMDELNKGYRVGIPDGISTDIIKIDEILHQKIVNIVPLADTGTCPSDIIETNSIPLKDITLRMYPMADSPSDFLSFDVRIKIYETAPIAFYNENGYTGKDLIGEIGFINHNIVFPIIEICPAVRRQKN